MPETEIGPAAIKRMAASFGLKFSNKQSVQLLTYLQRQTGPVLAATVETYLRRVYSDITGDTAARNIDNLERQAA